MVYDRKFLSWSAVALIVIVGAIHMINAPDSFQEAHYKGWLFYLNGAGALAAACGIFRGQHWGWYLGLMVAVGSFLGYVASRTIGLPLIAAEPEAWFEPLGVLSLMVEAAFITLFAARTLKMSYR